MALRQDVSSTAHQNSQASSRAPTPEHQGWLAAYQSAFDTLIGYLWPVEEIRTMKRFLDLCLVGSTISGEVVAQCATANTSQIDLSWHVPNATDINNLRSVINGTGVYGFIFNSSVTPATS